MVIEVLLFIIIVGWLFEAVLIINWEQRLKQKLKD
ncbi:hypothetical protein A5875_003489 [Enterococcus sp. 3H8_DIV0648]|nr:hypothetical protein A5875_003489 [Enterococcus sp. 3H8_DIV0648]